MGYGGDTRPQQAAAPCDDAAGAQSPDIPTTRTRKDPLSKSEARLEPVSRRAYAQNMVRVVITGLGVAVIGGTMSGVLGLGATATECLMIGSVIVGAPVALGVRLDDVRKRLR